MNQQEKIKVCELIGSSVSEPTNFYLALELAKSQASDIGNICLECVAEITQAVIAQFDSPYFRINPYLNLFDDLPYPIKEAIKVKFYKGIGAGLPKPLYKQLFSAVLHYYLNTDIGNKNDAKIGTYYIGAICFKRQPYGGVKQTIEINGRNIYFWIYPMPVPLINCSVTITNDGVKSVEIKSPKPITIVKEADKIQSQPRLLCNSQGESITSVAQLREFIHAQLSNTIYGYEKAALDKLNTKK